jgi:hypothetical protein
MKNAITSLLFIAGLILCGAPYATAQDQPEQHTLKDGEARTGSKFRDVLVRSGGIPLNMRCDQLNDEQKVQLKAPYANMGEGDEPPFPAAGLAAMLSEVQKAGAILYARGLMRMHANVNAQGKVTTVAVMKSIDSRLDMCVAGVLMRTPFKPALCRGEPCAQEYLFLMNFTVEP